MASVLASSLDASSGIVEHALGGLSCSVRSLQGDAHLFQFLGEHAAVTLGYAACPSGLLACTSFVLDGHLAIPDLLQALPDGPYGLGVGVIDVADVGPQLPLHPDGLLLGLGFGPDAVPHVFENAGMFLAGVLELILLGDMATDLGQLEPSADDLLPSPVRGWLQPLPRRPRALSSPS